MALKGSRGIPNLNQYAKTDRMNDKYKEYIRANLFGSLLRAVIDLIGKQHSAIASEVLIDILKPLATEADKNGVSRADFLSALEPDFKVAWEDMRKVVSKRPRRWTTMTEGERAALMHRFLMLFHYHSWEVVPENKLKEITEKSLTKTCIERKLRKEVLAGTMLFTARCLMSKKGFRELQKSWKDEESKTKKVSKVST